MTEQNLSEKEIRALAVSVYNAAFEAVDSGENSLLALELAAASLHLWRKVGNDQNLTIGYWLYSRALVGAGNYLLAIEAAEKSLEHLSKIENPADWLMASAHEGLARALVAADDHRADEVIEKARQLVANIADSDDRELIQAQFSTISN